MASHPSFQAADVHTGFIPQHFDTLFPPLKISDTILGQAAVALTLNEFNSIKRNSINSNNRKNPFTIESNLRLNHIAVRDYGFTYNNIDYNVSVKNLDGDLHVKINDGAWKIVKTKNLNETNRFSLRCSIDGTLANFSAVISPETITIFNESGKNELKLKQPKFLSNQEGAGGAASSKVVSPMPGVLDKLLVGSGDTVKAGDPLAVIIAMKMEHVLKASRDGTVKSVGGKPGDNVAKGAAIVTFDELAEEKE